MSNDKNTHVADSSPAKRTKTFMSSPGRLSGQKFSPSPRPSPSGRGRPRFQFSAKGVALVVLGAIFLITGCARHYNITLNNGHVITTNSKPKRSKTGDAFVYKDRLGKWTAVPAGSVRQIEPRPHGSTPDIIYKPP